MRPAWTWTWMALAVALAGCGSSPPSTFFVLEPLAGSAPAPAAKVAPIRVAAVHLPSVLDRAQLVRALGSNRLEISDRDRWGAPLGDMTRRVLAQDLAARLPPGAVVFPHSPAPPGCRQLVLDVQSFQPAADGRTVLEADWSILAGDPQAPVLRRRESLATASSGDSAAQAAAMSRLLSQLADRIATALSAAG